MLALGESGRHGFKRDVGAIEPAVLVALANTVALDETLRTAYLLVGVDEEDVDGDHPFLRVEVRPTMPPHYDREGRRQTRQGRSTRALTDEELLQIHLDREAGSFAARFRQTSTELQTAVGAVGGQVEQIAAAIDQNIARPIADLAESAEYAAVSASGAESAAESISYDVATLERRLEVVSDLIGKIHALSPEQAAAQVFSIRRRVWWVFTSDTWERSSVQADRLNRDVRRLLDKNIETDSARNVWELRAWRDLLTERKHRRRSTGTLTWWRKAIDEIVEWLANPAYQAPELPDVRAELREDFDRALDDPESVTRRFKKLLDP